MILAALTNLSPAVRWAMGALAAVCVLATLWLTINAREEADDTRNIERGKAEQREADQAATIDNARKADHAEQKLRRDPAARDAECLRYATNPADC